MSGFNPNTPERGFDIRHSADPSKSWNWLGAHLTREMGSTTPEAWASSSQRTYANVGIQGGRVAWPAMAQAAIKADTLNADAFFARRVKQSQSSTPNGIANGDGVRMLNDVDAETPLDVMQVLALGDNVEPIYHLDVPEGIDGIVVRGAEPGRFKNNVFLPIWNNQLVAHHNDDAPPQWSSIVHDIDGKRLDQKRKAGLHGPFWVKGLAESECAGTHIPHFQVAFNFTRARGTEPYDDLNAQPRSVVGFGLATFNASGAGTNQGNSGPTTGQPGPQPIPDDDDTRPKHPLSSGPTTGGRPIHFKRKDRHTLAYLSADTMFGPLWCGHHKNDKHKFGENADRESVNSGHIHTNAYFYESEERDAPLEFAGDYIKPQEGRHPWKVDLRYDINSFHAWKCGRPRGLWRWETWLPETVVEPGKPPKPPGGEPPTTGGPRGSPGKTPGFEPGFRWSTLEQQIPSIFPMPRPGILAGASPVDGHPDSDWMRSPRVGHWLTTGKLAVSTAIAGKSGVDACPPLYTAYPQGDDLNTHTPGTSPGVQWYASPEMKDHLLRHDVASGDVPTLSTTYLGLYGTSGQTILGFGKASSDLGSVVSGMRISLSGGYLNFQSVDSSGASDTVNRVRVNGEDVTTSTGSDTPEYVPRFDPAGIKAIKASRIKLGINDEILLESGSASLPTLSFASATGTGMYQTSAGANSLGWATNGTRRAIMGTTGYTIEGTSFAFGVEGNSTLGTDTSNTVAMNGAINTSVRFATSLTTFYVFPLDRATTGTAYTFNLWGQNGKIGTNSAGGPMVVQGGNGDGSGAGGQTSIQGGPSDSGTPGAINIGTTRGAVNISKSGGTLGFYGVTAVARSSAYTVANPTTDRALDVTGDTLAQVAQVLGTLIADLQLTGIIG